MIEVKKELKEQYDNQYQTKTDEWRRIGAIGKVENINLITKGRSYNNVVEIGAGEGSILEQLSQCRFAKSYTAVEISSSAIEQIKLKSIDGLDDIVQFNGYELPFADKQFELAICSHVIEHVEHPRALLREIRRVSKQQLFEIPIDFSFHVDKKAKHFLAYGHINIYTPPLFDFLLKTEEFQILSSRSSLYHNQIITFHHKKTSLAYLAFVAKK